MAIIDKVKNTYQKIKSSIKESIFSKNKSLIRFSEFNKKPFSQKVLLTTFINMLFTVPFVILFSTPDFSGLQYALQFMFSFFSVFMIANIFTFSGLKLFSLFYKKLKNKISPEFQPAFTVKDDESKPEYFPKGFMNRIKEFFISTFSIAASFIPFLILVTIILSFFGIESNLSTFNFSSILELDAIMLITLTTVTSLTTYSFTTLFLLKDKLLKLIQKKKEEQKDNKQEEEPYIPKRAFPAEEFAVSLHQDFKKSHDINAYEELKVMTKEIPQKQKE